ncbi:MAG: ABC transporter permease [Gemmatimonadaceae bacterium]
MTSLLQDIRYALRTLGGSRAFVAGAVLTLALGIGATVAVFTLVNGVLLRPLPYGDPARIALIWTKGESLWSGSDKLPLSAANFLDIREQTSTFERVAAFRAWPYSVSEVAEPEQVTGARVSAALFPVLAVRPLLGRVFTADEERVGAPRVAVLSYGLWQRKYGGSPAILGRQVTLGGERHTVVGVMPRGFAFPRGAELPAGLQFGARTEVWTPLVFTAEDARNRGTQNLAGIGRLKPGVSQAQAQSDLAAIAKRLAPVFPPFAQKGSIAAVPMREQATAGARSGLLVLMGAVSFVLLIACTNVASLLVGRTSARRRELAVRAALGASRGRLIRQLVTEDLMLALAGAALGALLALWAKDAMLSLVPGDLPRADDVALDWRVLAVTLVIALGAGATFGVLTGLHAAGGDLAPTLHGLSGRTTAGLSRRRSRQALVAVEVALSLTLLIGAGLLGASFLRLGRVSPGFEPRHALNAELLIPLGSEFNPARDGARWSAVFTDYTERLGRIPGVRAAGGVSSLPLTGAVESAGFYVGGQPKPAPGQAPEAEYSIVTPDYFRAMGVALLRGRSFTAGDRAKSAPVAMINATLARKFWPGQDPVGQRIGFGFEENVWREIVGVVGDVKQTSLEAESAPAMFLPETQFPYPFMSLVVRADGAGDPAALLPAMRRELRAVDPGLALSGVRSLGSVFAESMAQRRFSLVLLGCFAGMAVALAVVGLYSVISLSVAQRAREIGVRMALGARPRDALGLVLGEGARVVGAGLVLGLVAAIPLARVLRSQLFQVSTLDPWVYAAVSALLVIVAFAASYIPARRAARVDPAVVLRAE